MSYTRIHFAFLASIMFGAAACSSGGGTQDPAPPTVESGSSPGTAVSCAHNATPFSPATSNMRVRLELEHYNDCGSRADSRSDGTSDSASDTASDSTSDSASDTASDSSSAPYQGNVNIFAFDSGGHWIGDIQEGKILTYSITVPKAGFYDLTMRVRPPSPSSKSDALIALAANGRDLPATEITISARTSDAWRDIILPLTYFSDGLQQLQLAVVEGGADLDYLDWQYVEEHQKPAATVAAMGIGINLGNTLDAPTEGEWAAAAERRFFEDFAEAGFGHVRIPVTWGNHVSTSAPYTIDPVFLERVEQVVDWGLAQGLYVILNAHHESWLKEHYDDADKRARFAAVWRQVATHMQQKPGRLMFEILNEPVGMTITEVDQLNSTILAILRESNPTRAVVFSGKGFTPVDSLLAAAIPNDDHLIGNFHSYDPWPFAGQCTRSWGSTEDRALLAALYQKAADWSARTGIPVMVNEFGAAHYDHLIPENVCNPQTRLEYLSAHVEQARSKGIAATVWDDNGSFQIYHRQQGGWGDEKAVLLKRR